MTARSPHNGSASLHGPSVPAVLPTVALQCAAADSDTHAAGLHLPADIGAPEMTEKYGMWCYGCKEDIEVDLIDDDTERASKELENKGRGLGWGMGLVASGQAFYSCPGCAPCLYNFRIFPGHKPRSDRVTEQGE
jgi:hypothetical protein